MNGDRRFLCKDATKDDVLRLMFLKHISDRVQKVNDIESKSLCLSSL